MGSAKQSLVNTKLVRIDKFSESQVLVRSFKDVKDQISKEFRFKAPDYFFHPLYKKKLWDGYIKLYNKSRNTFPIGLVPELLTFLKSKGFDIQMDPKIPPFMVRNNIDPEEYFSRQSAIDLYYSLNLPEKEFQLREDQINAVVHAIRYERCMLISGTGSGKSLIIYMLIRYYLGLMFKELKKYPRRSIVIIVPTTSLVEQMYKDFDEYSQYIDPELFNVERFCHRIYSGAKKKAAAPVIISTWQSLDNIEDKDYFKSFQILIGDEAHTFKSNSLMEIMVEKMTKAKVRVGTTGSLDDYKIHRLMLKGIFGPIKKIVTAKEMIEKGISSKLHINCVRLIYKKPERVHMIGRPYKEEMEFLWDHEDRNEYLLELVEGLEGNSLILFRSVKKQGKKLLEMFKEHFRGSGRKILYVTGSTPTFKREEVREFTEKNEGVIILATVGVFSTGINIRNLQHYIPATPMKAKITIVQSIGRILRKDGKANECFVWDLVDDLRYKENINYAYKHARKRFQIYNSEGHDYELVTHNL